MVYTPNKNCTPVKNVTNTHLNSYYPNLTPLNHKHAIIIPNKRSLEQSRPLVPHLKNLCGKIFLSLSPVTHTVILFSNGKFLFTKA